jgi:phosphatidylinositol-bisphosphatase
MVGNKGGAAISFYFHNTSLLFISSHFAAHQDMVERRNEDYREIIRRMRLGMTNEHELLLIL